MAGGGRKVGDGVIVSYRVHRKVFLIQQFFFSFICLSFLFWWGSVGYVRDIVGL